MMASVISIGVLNSMFCSKNGEKVLKIAMTATVFARPESRAACEAFICA